MQQGNTLLGQLPELSSPKLQQRQIVILCKGINELFHPIIEESSDIILSFTLV
jgi:hypothetical protein